MGNNKDIILDFKSTLSFMRFVHRQTYFDKYLEV